MYVPPGVQLSPVQHFELLAGDPKLAYRRFEVSPPARNGLLYCQGLRSDMQGCKSVCLEVESRMRLHSNCVRFDFEGQGLSDGDPDQISIQKWVANTISMLDNVCGPEPQILIGNSMGAWVALHAAIQRPERVKALVLIAPAVDVTELWLRRMSPEEKQLALQSGRVPLVGGYTHEGDSLPLAFFEASRAVLLMGGPAKSIPVRCPVRIFHGMRDAVVPASLCRELMEKLHTDDVHVTLIKDGDHRLARPQDMSAVLGVVQEMIDY